MNLPYVNPLPPFTLGRTRRCFVCDEPIKPGDIIVVGDVGAIVAHANTNCLEGPYVAE